MHFYEDIVHRLYIWKTDIDETHFSDPYEFIEAKHKLAPYKGKVFYQNILKALPNHFGAQNRNDFFKELVDYCKTQIRQMDKPLSNESFIKAKKYFDETYSTFVHTGTKDKFLIDEIERTLKSINTYKKNMPLSVEGHNRIPYEGGIMYLEYLEGIKNNKLPEATNAGHKPNVKIKWNGDQKQLAELFITLEKLEWIEPIQDGQRQSICRNICDLFDISHTKKTKNSNEVNSFTEIMKADTDKKTKVKTYSKVYSPRYKTKFSGIAKKP